MRPRLHVVPLVCAAVGCSSPGLPADQAPLKLPARHPRSPTFRATPPRSTPARRHLRRERRPAPSRVTHQHHRVPGHSRNDRADHAAVRLSATAPRLPAVTDPLPRPRAHQRARPCDVRHCRSLHGAPAGRPDAATARRTRTAPRSLRSRALSRSRAPRRTASSNPSTPARPSRTRSGPRRSSCAQSCPNAEHGALHRLEQRHRDDPRECSSSPIRVAGIGRLVVGLGAVHGPAKGGPASKAGTRPPLTSYVSAPMTGPLRSRRDGGLDRDRIHRRARLVDEPDLGSDHKLGGRPSSRTGLGRDRPRRHGDLRRLGARGRAGDGGEDIRASPALRRGRTRELRLRRRHLRSRRTAGSSGRGPGDAHTVRGRVRARARPLGRLRV